MKIDTNEVVTQLGDASVVVQDNGAEMVRSLRRIDNAVRLLTLVVVAPVVVKLVVGLVGGAAMGASYLKKHNARD
jgi:hypothetical protein